MRPLVSALLTLGVLSSQPTAAEPQRPKVLTFVAGIEHYDNAELDKLIYAADDARDVHGQLGTVAELDRDSKLLVADDGDGGSVSAQQLRAELAKFARKLRNDSNVVVYLGGHGALSPTKELWYLPSDYDPAEQINYVPFLEILKYFDDQVRANSLLRVTATFLINVCGAGNAAEIADPNVRAQAVNENQELIAEAQRLYRELQFGTMQVSIIPATPRDRNAFEDDTLERSRFAHHLLEGMKGTAAGADGKLTAGGLFAHVEKGLGEELPKNPGFKNDILIGRTNRLEGEAHLVLGTALLGAAQAIEPADKGPGAPERASHARVLLDLAVDHLRQVEGRNPELSPRAQLRLAQAALVLNRQEREILSDLADEQLLSALERREAEALRIQATFPTLRSFRDHVMNDDRSAVVIISDRQTVEDSNLWKRYFLDIGKQVVQLYIEEIDDQPFEDAFKTLRNKDEEHRAANGAAPLVVVYTGMAWLEGEGFCTIPDLSEQVNLISCPLRLGPIGQDTIARIRELWGAPFAFFFDADYGGFLLDGRPHDVPLLLAARERTGRAQDRERCYFGECPFSSGAEPRSQLLIRAFHEGAEDPARFAELSFLDKLPEGGTPAWVPDGPDLARMARDQVAPLERLGLHVIAGCLSLPLTDCDLVGRFGPDRHDVLEQLEDAAVFDLSRKNIDAAGAYRQVVADFGALPPANQGGLGVKEATEALTLLSDIVGRRASGAASKEGRRILVLPLGVEDYSSPLIADVPHAVTDLAAYTKGLKEMLEDETTRVNVWPASTPASAADFFQRLIAARAELEGRPQDLLILVFNGRGTAIGGRRYLATADAQGAAQPASALLDGEQERNGQSVSWNRDYLVDLGEIARTVRGGWFLGIYDAQFTPPVLDPGRADQLLDKHLDSVRPREQRSPTPGTDKTPIEPDAIGWKVLARGDLPPRQVHLWTEGRLTQNPTVPHPCLVYRDNPPEAASPLAAAVLSSLPPDEPGTYRDWLTLLARSDCLKMFGAELTLVMQGDVNVPLLASGEGAEFVDYFQDGIARRDLNLRSALAIARDAAQRFTSARNILAEAALLVALAQLHGEDALLHGFDAERSDWLARAEELLDGIGAADLENAGIDLRPIRLEVLSRVYLLRGEPERAREILREAPDPVLSQRELVRRLVAMTQESLRSQPGEILDRIGARLAAVEDQISAAVFTGHGDRLKSWEEAETLILAVEEFWALVQAERARLAEPYHISLPEATP